MSGRSSQRKGRAGELELARLLQGYGYDVQPKRALDGVKDRLADDGFFLKPCPVKKSGKTANGFMIQRIDTNTPEQVGL